MKNIEVKIENAEATLYFNGLLTDQDFLLYWKGIDPDNNDASDSKMSETLQAIRDIYLDCVLEGGHSDFQVWGPVNGASEPSFGMHIDPAKVPSMVCRLREKFGDIEVEYTGGAVDTLLEKYIVVELNDTESEDRIRVTRRANFENMNLCGAYENYGRTVGCEDAGCYVFSNSESTVALDFSKELYEKFPGVEAIVDENEMSHREFCEFFIDSMNHKTGRDLFGVERFKEMLAFFTEWEAANTSHTEVTGWTFHDGHNFKTIILDEHDENACTELAESEQIDILLQMPEFPHMDGFYTTEDAEAYTYHFDRYAENPWHCYVNRK